MHYRDVVVPSWLWRGRATTRRVLSGQRCQRGGGECASLGMMHKRAARVRIRGRRRFCECVCPAEDGRGDGATRWWQSGGADARRVRRLRRDAEVVGERAAAEADC